MTNRQAQEVSIATLFYSPCLSALREIGCMMSHNGRILRSDQTYSAYAYSSKNLCLIGPSRDWLMLKAEKAVRV